ncbi:Core-2/I-Branching enzyme, partial [Ostertagia ostertagi]
VIKSVYETISIFQALDGTNDIVVTNADPRRWDHSAKWDIRSLGLFPDETKATPLQLNTTLKIMQGLAQASISRDAVNWMVNTIDLTNLMDQFNNDRYAIDELLLASLKATFELGMPGRFATSCLKANRRRRNTPYFTR